MSRDKDIEETEWKGNRWDTKIGSRDKGRVNLEWMNIEYTWRIDVYVYSFVFTYVNPAINNNNNNVCNYFFKFL